MASGNMRILRGHDRAFTPRASRGNSVLEPLSARKRSRGRSQPRRHVHRHQPGIFKQDDAGMAEYDMGGLSKQTPGRSMLSLRNSRWRETQQWLEGMGLQKQSQGAELYDNPFSRPCRRCSASSEPAQPAPRRQPFVDKPLPRLPGDDASYAGNDSRRR